MTAMTTTLDHLLAPKSVAVVGASDNPSRIGGRPLNYFLTKGFEGTVHAVNPNRETVQGIPACPTLEDVPGDVDFVLVAVPAPTVNDVVRTAVAKNAKTVMVFSSGFAEASEQGAVWQDEMAAIVAGTGTRIVGPNCLGMFSEPARFYPTFTSSLEYVPPIPGHIGLASQSGAYGSHMYYVARRRGLGIRYWVTSGNECDVHTAEVIRLMAEADDVNTIVAYAESIKDGDALIEALDIARSNRKPVVIMKVGRSEIGAHAASSHTASLAGEDAIYDMILREGGAYRARSTEEMLDVAIAARPQIYPVGKNVGLVTISGGAGVLMADAAEDYGIDVGPMPEAAQAELKELVPFAGPRNPVDVTAQFFNDLSLIDRFTKLMLEEGGYDGLVGFWTTVAANPNLSSELISRVKMAMDGREDVLFIQSLVGGDDIVSQYEDAGFPCIEDPSRAVRAMAAMMFYGAAFARAPRVIPTVDGVPTLPDGPLGEREAKQVLAAAGLPMVPDILATTAEEARAAVASLGTATAMKIASPDILHKSEAGGVALGIDAEAAAATFGTLMSNARAYAPDARIDGILISPMVRDGVEMILGAKVDPVFGPVVMAGLGGIFTEIFGDVAFRKAPIGPEEARAMLAELKGAPVLEGARGQAGADMDALADAISKLSIFAAAHGDTIESVEMNPVRARPDGVIALDALIVRRQD